MKSNSAKSSSEEGRSFEAPVKIDPGANELHLGGSDTYKLTLASGGTKQLSSPRFKEIHKSDSSINSTHIAGDNQLANKMKNNIQYLHEHDAVQGELKVLEMCENKEIKNPEIEYEPELHNEKDQYIKAQEDRAAEMHNVQLRFQEEGLNLKESAAICNVKKLKESTRN
ncbi:hypothetical protein O181_022337 [Austropuccinia psidii MF-1]|uniref:Uncharacterized protein n=1 Tax=Austropuccinia psidii MF-1 TaxID=1389203 RepID=A0A9Q3GX14_9BASI|nr:hypothetical protein [Austropuccinia psidii MF-1]